MTDQAPPIFVFDEKALYRYTDDSGAKYEYKGAELLDLLFFLKTRESSIRQVLRVYDLLAQEAPQEAIREYLE